MTTCDFQTETFLIQTTDSVKITPILFFLLLYLCAPAQDTLFAPDEVETQYLEEEESAEYTPFERPPYHPPPLEPVAVRTVEKKQWDEAAGTLDYSKDIPKPPKKRKPRNFDANPFDWTAATQGWGSIWQTLAVMLAIAGIAYGIWWMLQAPRNRLIARDGVEITLDNLDQYLHETDLDRFLREALAQGNFTLAIRLYYLQIIKELSEKNAIRWSREKTNRDYLREMRGHPLAESFRETTRTYEFVWYGNQALDAQGYARLEPQFKNLLARIGRAQV